jgi:putative DNA-invertase from lambdoid prophage Rac
MNRILKAGLYARTSTVDQQSIPAQFNELREFCERRGWKVGGEFSEQLSGADDRRPERERLMNLAKGGKVDVIIVYRLSRWSRSVIDLFSTLADMHAANVAFVSTSEGFDLSTPTGRLVAGLLAVIAQFEREIINENVRLGIEEYRRANGGKWGRPKTPEHLRLMIRQLWEHGNKPAYIAQRTKLPRSTVYDEIKRLKEE